MIYINPITKMEYFVSRGIGGPDGACFTVSRAPGKDSVRRVKSINLPCRDSFVQAEADLAAYAQRTGLVVQEEQR